MKSLKEKVNSAVQINLNWLRLFYTIIGVAAIVLGGVWWLAGVSAKEQITKSVKTPSDATLLYIERNTVSDAELHAFRSVIFKKLDAQDLVLSRIDSMLIAQSLLVTQNRKSIQQLTGALPQFQFNDGKPLKSGK